MTIEQRQEHFLSLVERSKAIQFNMWGWLFHRKAYARKFRLWMLLRDEAVRQQGLLIDEMYQLGFEQGLKDSKKPNAVEFPLGALPLNWKYMGGGGEPIVRINKNGNVQVTGKDALLKIHSDNLQAAIKSEDYERAAELRDLINNLKTMPC